MDDNQQLPGELLTILVLVLLIVIPLALFALSKLCCNVLSLYSEYKLDKRRRLANVADRSRQSSFSSAVKSEKLMLIDSGLALERETGVRLDDYPFAIDYARPLVIPSMMPMIMAPVYQRNNANSGSSDKSETLSNSSQRLGSDSPGSDPFPGSTPIQSSDDEFFKGTPPLSPLSTPGSKSASSHEIPSAADVCSAAAALNLENRESVLSGNTTPDSPNSEQDGLVDYQQQQMHYDEHKTASNSDNGAYGD